MSRWILFSIAVSLVAAPWAASAAEPLTSDARREVIAQVNSLLDTIYVIPETADVMRRDLEDRLQRGEFDRITSAQEFADTLTGILQGISHDRHLRVGLEGGSGTLGGPVRVRQGAPSGEGDGPVRVRLGSPSGEGDGPVRVRQGAPSAEGDGPVRVRRVARPGGEDGGEPTPGRRVIRSDNAADNAAAGEGDIPAGLTEIDAFPESRMLPGNVGYVRITLFRGLPGDEELAAALMAKVAGADALIFDLRGCMGGFPDMVHFITSYLYDETPRHLLTYYHADGPPDSAYTLVEIPGERMPNADVYILTSSFTASGGEEFTHVLKHHGRATVVGETTAGAGHGGGVHPLPHGFNVFMPDFRPVHPVTGDGWEDRGVEPDVAVAPSRALEVAQVTALEARLARGAGTEEDVLRGEVARLRQAIESATPDPAALQQFVGRYDIREVTAGDAGLYLQRTGGPRLELVPDSADQFHLAVMPDGLIRFVRGDDGAVVAVEVRYPNSDEWQRSWRDGFAPAR
ncbi:MAG: hypothetical protein DHS20C21_24260 [Gemmatimonadota bacterium]|nr:MAG: hypothetical protein DHS20C21_24260 [Gemmatimonadota bacterium]